MLKPVQVHLKSIVNSYKQPKRGRTIKEHCSLVKMCIDPDELESRNWIFKEEDPAFFSIPPPVSSTKWLGCTTPPHLVNRKGDGFFKDSHPCLDNLKDVWVARIQCLGPTARPLEYCNTTGRLCWSFRARSDRSRWVVGWLVGGWSFWECGVFTKVYGYLFLGGGYRIIGRWFENWFQRVYLLYIQCRSKGLQTTKVQQTGRILLVNKMRWLKNSHKTRWMTY